MGRIDDILKRLEALYPDARAELEYSNNFELLISVILSAQSTDDSVNRVTPALFADYPTPESLAEAPVEDLEAHLRPLGLYKNKAKHIKRASHDIATRFNGRIPESQSSLESLAGVGRKTANVVRSVAFNIPRIAVDTHVARVSKRLKIAEKGDVHRKIEEKLMQQLPESHWSKAHHQMIFFGRYRCKARTPRCDECPLKPWCRFPDIDV